jgi:hypothetical protein
MYSRIKLQPIKKSDGTQSYKPHPLFRKKTRDSFAWGINDNEKVVGSYYRTKKLQQGYVWSKKKGAKDSNLKKLKAKASIGKAINNKNVVVGLYRKKPGAYRVFAYKKGIGVYDLGIRSAPLDQLDDTSINDNGVVLVSSGNKSYAVFTDNLKSKIKSHKKKRK